MQLVLRVVSNDLYVDGEYVHIMVMILFNSVTTIKKGIMLRIVI